MEKVSLTKVFLNKKKEKRKTERKKGKDTPKVLQCLLWKVSRDQLITTDVI
jgi:hypothetical protein